jgi:hypothetical protein
LRLLDWNDAIEGAAAAAVGTGIFINHFWGNVLIWLFCYSILCFNI